MEINIKEVLRYMGQGQPNDVVLNRIDQLMHPFNEMANPKVFFVEKQLIHLEGNKVKIGDVVVESKSLKRHLKNATRILLFGATLGLGIDRLIRKTSLMNMGDALILEAIAAAYLEEYADEEQEKIQNQMENEFLGSRFSPGYGDFDLKYQVFLVDEMKKTLGLSVTSNFMIIPRKSITAVIGVVGKKPIRIDNKCKTCGLEDCTFKMKN